MSRLTCFVIVLVSILGVWTNGAFGTVVTLDASADTFISDHIGLGDADTNYNGRHDMWCITDIHNVSAYPMVVFDLTPYAGLTALGDATFQAYLYSGFRQDSPREVQAGKITKPWDPATVTYNIFGPPLSGGVDWIPSAITSVTWSESQQDPHYVGWTIPQGIVQGWIDDPSTNHGVMLWNSSPRDWEYDLVFHTLECPTLPNPSQLILEVIPEPSSGSMLAVLGLFGGGMAWRRHRRTRKSLQG